MTDAKNSAQSQPQLVTHIDYPLNQTQHPENSWQPDHVSARNQNISDVTVAVDFKNNMEDSAPADVHVTIDDNERRKEKEKGLLITHNTAGVKLKDKDDYKPGAYAINEHERNDDKNPYREGTNTLPILIRRIDSAEILPKPFKTTLQLIVCSYISCLCCFCCGVWATKYAFKTKLQRNKGLYTAATGTARRTMKFMIGGFIGGLIIIALVLGLTFGVFLKS